MENIFVEFLPPWVETGLQPAFYDKESGTVLQQTARMYARVNMLIRMFNKLSKQTKTTVDEYIDKFNELYTYVHDYFDNLDVQEEINNKLDQMLEDGVLEEIILQFLQSTAVWCFNTVADMKLATNLIVGSYAQTLGFHTINDGGDGLYYITNTGTANEMDVIAVGDLFANLVTGKETNIRQLGAYGDNTHDDTDAIKRAIAIGKSIFIPNGTYLTSDVLTLPNDVHLHGESFNDAVIKKTGTSSPNAIINFDETGEVIIENLCLDCNSTADYGIYADITIKKFEFKDLKISTPVVAGIYTNKSTYLASIVNVRVYNSSNYGFYLVPTDRNSYTNTSINLSHCYVSEAQNAYRIDGSYMNMENCCADGIYQKVFDLRGYVGTLVSCGSESYYSDYMFYGDNFTNATVVNAETFASYDKADSVHIYTGGSSTWVFVGGKLAIKYHTELNTGLGRFLEQSNDSHIKFIGTEVSGTFEKPSIVLEGLEVNDYKGTVFNKGDILYTGYNNDRFGDEINTTSLPSSAIYMGISDKPFVIDSRRVTSRGTHTGDMYITKTPSKIGGMGWISDAEYTGNIANGTYFKIPVVQNGATGSEPRQGLVLGDMYYDTTLGLPKWCTSVGKQQQDKLTLTTQASVDGNITLTINGVDYTVAIKQNMTNTEFYEALLKANISDVVFRDSTTYITCDSKLYKNYGGAMFTINAGSTGAVITDTVVTNGGNPHWTSLTELVGQ